MIYASQQFARLAGLLRLGPFDTATEGGRSKERLRRAGLTTISAGMAKAIGLLASLISVPLTFRYLGPERYGIWMVLISVIAAMGFADLGIGNGLMNAVSEAYGKDDHRLAREHVTSALALMLCIAAFLAIAGAVGYPYLPWMRLLNVKSEAAAAEGASAFLVLYASFVINIPLGIITRAQAGLQKDYLSQIVSAFGSILTLAAILVVIYLRGSLIWLVFASVTAGIMATLFNGWILFRKHPWLLPSRHAFRWTSTQMLFTLGLLFFVIQCAVAVSYTSDNIVIAQVMGAAAVAAYAVPQKLFSIISIVLGMGLMPLWPAYGEAIARGDVAWVRRVYLASFRITLAFTLSISTILALAGPFILRVVVGRSLHVPGRLLAVLAVWGVIYGVGYVFAMLLNGAGVLKCQAITAVVASLSNLALSIYFTRMLGVIGVCLGSIVTQLLITFPVSLILIRNLFRRLDASKMKSNLRAAIDMEVSIEGRAG